MYPGTRLLPLIKRFLKYEYSQPSFFSPVKENAGFAHVASPTPPPSKQRSSDGSWDLVLQDSGYS